jgi:lauroyl/myristoyl acyltransferase
MKNSFKSACGLFFFFFIRRLERVLSVRGLYRILKPIAFARAILNTAFKKPEPAAPLPDGLGMARTVRLVRRQRTSRYLNHYLEYFPDRLAESKWMNNCRINGLDHLRQARQKGRPVVLAFCHFGPFFLLRSWLRAAGIPAALLIGGKAERRPELFRLLDRFTPFPEIQTVFYMDQLRESSKFLAEGNVLLSAMDGLLGKQMDVPFGEGWTIQMATGAIRMAIRHQAELIPCSIIDEGGWRFRIELGRPVPKNFLTAGSDLIHAGKHLIDEMIPHFMAHPEQKRFKRVFRTKTTSQPVESLIA